MCTYTYNVRYMIIEYAVQVGFELCAKVSVVGTPTPEFMYI